MAGAKAVIDDIADDLAGAVGDVTTGAGVNRLVEIEFGANLPLFGKIVKSR